MSCELRGAPVELGAGGGFVVEEPACIVSMNLQIATATKGAWLPIIGTAAYSPILPWAVSMAKGWVAVLA